MAKKSRAFVAMADGGGSNRSICQSKGSLAFSCSLEQGKRIAVPSKIPSIKFTTKGVPEDMPWCGEFQVVSRKLRDLIESEFPGSGQYIPLKVAGKSTGLEYFAANWLHVVDCIDLKKSEVLSYEKNIDGEMEYDFDRIVVDPKRVPANVFICRLKHFSITVVCDTAVRDVFRKHKITGPQFRKSI
jgi:hypothetical protein